MMEPYNRTNISKSKLKSYQSRKRRQKWKEHLKNLHGKHLEIKDKPSEEIIHSQLDIKLGHLTKDKLGAVLKTVESRKAAGLDEITPEVWKTRKFDDILI